MNNTLHLTLKRHWFEEILAGRKTEEYREDKPYWRRRLLAGKALTLRQVEFRNGYGRKAPRMVLECLGIENKVLAVEGFNGGREQRYFVIKLGQVLEYTNASMTAYPRIGWKPIQVVQS